MTLQYFFSRFRVQKTKHASTNMHDQRHEDAVRAKYDMVASKVVFSFVHQMEKRKQ